MQPGPPVQLLSGQRDRIPAGYDAEILISPFFIIQKIHMKHFLLLALLSICAHRAFSQTAYVSEILLNQDVGTVTIRYILQDADPGDFIVLKLTAVSHGRAIPVKTATGDIGKGIKPAGQKTIVWDAFQDNLQDTTDLDFKFEFISLPGKYAQNGDKLAAPGRVTGPLVTMGIGLGIGLYGLVPYSQSKQLYDTYQSNLNPRSSVFSETSRNDHFEQANNKLRTAQIAAAAGGVVVLSGFISYLSYKKRQRQWQTIKSWSLEPSVLEQSSLFPAGWAGSPLGFKMTFNLSK